MPPSAGSRFGRYELLELLGRGSMGEVYSATDVVLHRRVAVKLLSISADLGAPGPGRLEGAARILREARAAAGISHPNAIAIYDVGEIEGIPFLAMELVSGRTLRAFIGDGAVPLDLRIGWLADVARALAAAHELGLVHRDIKPENVMIQTEGTVKVLDFGIARRTDGPSSPHAMTADNALATLTAEGVVLGTPLYMAPEQMRGEPLDGRTDQFAWGVLACELLTGDVPWNRAEGALRVVSQILSHEVEPLTARNPGIPVAVDAVVRRALSKSASDRFASMAEIAEALDPSDAPSAPHGEPAATPSRSAPGAPVSATTGKAQVSPVPPAPGVAPRSGWPWLVAIVAALAAGVSVTRFVSHRSAPVNPPPDASLTPVTESQMSSSAEATGAYKAGMQALRDGSQRTAYYQFSHAIALDPAFAAAHLRRALLAGEEISNQTRQDLQAARNSRATLGDHDRLLLDAVQPWSSTPADLRETQRRLEAALVREPASADFAYELGWTLGYMSEHVAAEAAFDRAIASDPSYALSWRRKARERIALDDVPGAARAYGKCLDVSPSAASCLEDLGDLQSEEGSCRELESTARHLVAAAPDLAFSYRTLADALVSLDRPEEAIRGALVQKWDRWPADDRRKFAPLDEAALAMLTGRFDDAQRWDGEAAKQVASLADELPHFRPEYERILVDLEVGRTQEALGLARDYLRRRAAWQANEFLAEPTIFLYAVQLKAGALTKDEFVRLRGEWVARYQRRVDGAGVQAGYAGTLWRLGYALTATTPEEARSALASKPDLRPLISALKRTPMEEEPIGRLYQLAGDLDAAKSWLSSASHSCGLIGNAVAPMYATWASFDLGQTLEAQGNRAGACAEYRRVLARWGAATPASRTAEKARSRAQALGCSP